MKNLENYTQATDFTTLTHIITTTMAEYFYLYFAECRTLANQKLKFELRPRSSVEVVFHLLNVAKSLFHSIEKTKEHDARSFSQNVMMIETK